MRVLNYKVAKTPIRITHKLYLVTTITKCPYNVISKQGQVEIGSGRCITCDFNIDYFPKSKKVICFADEHYDNYYDRNKHYKLLLTEKKMQ